MFWQVVILPGANLFNEQSLLMIFKGMFLVAAILYLIFALIVIRQIHVMRTTLITKFSPVVTLLGYIHFFLALGVLLLYLVML